MTSSATTPDAYIAGLPEEHKKAMQELRHILQSRLPAGFEEQMSHGMINYVVPHSLYPAGYHCNAAQPLPFVSVASQKNFVALYHMGLYSCPELLAWFTAAYPGHTKKKPDMGKSCIRFKKPAEIPFVLIGELAEKMTARQWIDCYENALNAARSKKKA